MRKKFSKQDHIALHESIAADLKVHVTDVVEGIQLKHGLADASEIRAELALLLHDDSFWAPFKKPVVKKRKQGGA